MTYLLPYPAGVTPADIDDWDDADDDLDPEIRAELEALAEQADDPEYMM